VSPAKAILEGAPDGDVARAVAAAVTALFDRDAFLFKHNANERSITHCLAIHLALRFFGWHVDCEYNRDGFDPEILHRSGEDEASETNGSRVYPDIIVHHRGRPGKLENLLVIEVKKTTSSRSDQFDLSKLKALREQLDYQHALFLRFRCGAATPKVETVVWT
jgi:hypothetical protein